MKRGQKIKLSDITLKKPGSGLKWSEKDKIIGKILIKNKSKNNLIKIADVKKNRKICVVINNRANYARIKYF